MDYPIYKGQIQLGKVQLLKEGLYYKLCCRCRSPGEQIYRLTAVSGEARVNLGILAPVGDGFGLDRKVPIRHLGDGDLEFQVAPAHGTVEGRFVPLSPTEPFSYLEHLKNSIFTTKNGRPGLIIKE